MTSPVFAWNVATTIGMTLGVMSKGTSYEDETDLMEGAAYAGGLLYVWNRTRILSAMGPYGLAYMGGAAVGTLLSGLVWGREGVTDAAQFYTGQGNYLFGDQHESGYFNVVKNVDTIVSESPLFSGEYWVKKYNEPESKSFSLADLGRHIKL